MNKLKLFFKDEQILKQVVSDIGTGKRVLVLGAVRKENYELINAFLEVIPNDGLHLLVCCPEEPGIQRPPHMGVYNSQDINRLEIHEIHKLTDLPEVLIAGSRRDPHTISCATMTDESIELVFKYGLSGLALYGVYGMETPNLGVGLEKLKNYSRKLGVSAVYWYANTLIVHGDKNGIRWIGQLLPSGPERELQAVPYAPSFTNPAVDK